MRPRTLDPRRARMLGLRTTSPTKRKPFRGIVRTSSLVLAAVADGLANRVDMAGERRFRNNAATPHGLDHMILAHHVVAIVNEEQQQIEDLRAHADRLRGSRQLAALGIKHTV